MEVKVPGMNGYNCELSLRDKSLESKYPNLVKFTKTGTTICGIVCKDAVILGADTRASAGEAIAQKDCMKIHYMAPNVYTCGAGTAADNEHVCEMVSSQLNLLRRRSKKPTRVFTAATLLKNYLFRYGGHVGAYLIVGGYDFTGPHLYEVYSNGSCSEMPFIAQGSGSLAAISVIENGYKEDLTIEQGKQLICKAVFAGILNDQGSGGSVTMCVIPKDMNGLVTPHFAAPSVLGDFRSLYSHPRDAIIPLGATLTIESSIEYTGKQGSSDVDEEKKT